MSVFLLCEQAIGLIRGKRLILSADERNLLEALNYEGLCDAHAQDEAVVCALHFERVRDNLLQSFAWIFARATETPAQLSEGVPGWRYSFALPSDCLKVLAVLAEDNRVNYYNEREQDLSKPPVLNELLEWEEASGKLFTNRTPVHIRYTQKITDINLWSGAFVDAFVIKLAEAIASPVGASGDLIQVLEKQFEQTIQIAMSNGVINAETGLPKQRETRALSEYSYYGYSGLPHWSDLHCD